MALYTRLALFVAATVVTAAPGQVPTAQPQVAVAPAPAAAASSVPPPAVARTFVYVFDGVDPLGLAGVHQLADRLRCAGFDYTRVGGWYSGDGFEREIRTAYAADPSARFALIGYSAGSYKARALANRLVQSGLPVAVVGYVGADYMQDTPETRVPGAGRVVNVTGDGYLLTGRNLLFNGAEVHGAWNERLVGTSHFDLPTHPRTFAVLHAALAEGGE